MKARWLDIGKVTLYCFCDFKNWDGVVVHKLTKNEQGQNPAILTEQVWWNNKGLIVQLSGNFSCGTQQTVLRKQDCAILLAWVVNHTTGIGSSCLLNVASHIIIALTLERCWKEREERRDGGQGQGTVNSIHKFVVERSGKCWYPVQPKILTWPMLTISKVAVCFSRNWTSLKIICTEQRKVKKCQGMLLWCWTKLSELKFK